MSTESSAGSGAGKPRPNNIQSPFADRSTWDNTDIEGSLDRLFTYVVEESNKSENWYWKNKTANARASHLMQWTAITLAGLAGIVPIWSHLKLLPGVGQFLVAQGIVGPGSDFSLVPSFLLGVAATLVGIHRASGISRGWTRFVLTGTAIRGACEEFKLDWTVLRAQLSSPPHPDQVGALIQRARTFRLAVEALVTKETQGWATELQNQLKQLEQVGRQEPKD